MKIIISLFDESGNALKDFAEGGYKCYAYDIKNTDIYKEGILYRKADLTNNDILKEIISLKPSLLMGFPPCTDLAVSGAAHFERKRKENPNFQKEAVELCRIVETVGIIIGCPWFLENPVSVLATKWRKPDFKFHPYEYGGYLPLNDIHPRYPEYIKPRDAYPKTTCLWTGGGWRMPVKKPVEIEKGYSNQHNKLGGKSERTKQIRSETPRGFAKANYLENRP